MEWVSLHCFWEGNACWTLTTAWTMARDPQFIILLSGVLYRFPLKTVSSSILVIPWCCAYFVLVKMPSCIWAHFILTSSLGAVSVLSTVKTNYTVPFLRIQSLPSSDLIYIPLNVTYSSPSCCLCSISSWATCPPLFLSVQIRPILSNPR